MIKLIESLPIRKEVVSGILRVLDSYRIDNSILKVKKANIRVTFKVGQLEHEVVKLGIRVDHIMKYISSLAIKVKSSKVIYFDEGHKLSAYDSGLIKLSLRQGSMEIVITTEDKPTISIIQSSKDKESIVEYVFDNEDEFVVQSLRVKYNQTLFKFDIHSSDINIQLVNPIRSVNIITEGNIKYIEYLNKEKRCQYSVTHTLDTTDADITFQNRQLFFRQMGVSEPIISVSNYNSDFTKESIKIARKSYSSLSKNQKEYIDEFKENVIDKVNRFMRSMGIIVDKFRIDSNSLWGFEDMIKVISYIEGMDLLNLETFKKYF